MSGRDHRPEPGALGPTEAPHLSVGFELSRRLMLGGALGGAALLAGQPSAADQLAAARTSTSPEGIVRTLLESAEDGHGNVFELILDTFPAGIVIPVHHHPAVGLNYILSGVAESQYEGEPMRMLRIGDSFQDHAETAHIHFRNPNLNAPLMILISHVLKKGQSFFIPGRS